MFFGMQNQAKSTQNGTLGVPAGLPGPPGASQGTIRTRFQMPLKINGKNEGFWETPGTSQQAPAEPEGPKNRPNINFLLKKYSKRRCPSIFVHEAVFRAFASLLQQFWHEKTMKNRFKKKTMQKSTSILTPIFIDFRSILGPLWGTISRLFFDFFTLFFCLLGALGPILGSRRRFGINFYRFFDDFGCLLDPPGLLFGPPRALLGYILGALGHSCRMCEINL